MHGDRCSLSPGVFQVSYLSSRKRQAKGKLPILNMNSKCRPLLNHQLVFKTGVKAFRDKLGSSVYDEEKDSDSRIGNLVKLPGRTTSEIKDSN